MIEFRGELSEKCKAVYLKRTLKTNIIIFNFTWIIIDIPVLLIAYFWKEASLYFYIFAGMVFIIALLNMFPFANPPQKTLALNIPIRVTIRDGKIEKEGKSENHYAVRELQDVKKVIDEGDWYQIIFYFPYKLAECICQKDLITEGTIEEFEELFQDRIERRIKEK